MFSPQNISYTFKVDKISTERQSSWDENRRSSDVPIGIYGHNEVLGGQPLAVEKAIEASAKTLPEYPILDVILSLEKAQVKKLDSISNKKRNLCLIKR